jgi:hypothetical protein
LADDLLTRASMSIEEATISNMWEIAAIVEALERKDLSTGQDLYNIMNMNEFRHGSTGVTVEVTQPYFAPRAAMCIPDRHLINCRNVSVSTLRNSTPT